MGDEKIRFCCGIAELCLSVCPGKTYSLTYARVKVEDAAEIKFVAEKAESRAQLTVKGKFCCSCQHCFCSVTLQTNSLPPLWMWRLKKFL